MTSIVKITFSGVKTFRLFKYTTQHKIIPISIILWNASKYTHLSTQHTYLLR